MNVIWNKTLFTLLALSYKSHMTFIYKLLKLYIFLFFKNVLFILFIYSKIYANAIQFVMLANISLCQTLLSLYLRMILGNQKPDFWVSDSTLWWRCRYSIEYSIRYHNTSQVIHNRYRIVRQSEMSELKDFVWITTITSLLVVISSILKKSRTYSSLLLHIRKSRILLSQGVNISMSEITRHKCFVGLIISEAFRNLTVWCDGFNRGSSIMRPIIPCQLRYCQTKSWK